MGLGAAICELGAYAMLYHYTDRLSAIDIRREGAIRATPLALHRDMFARDEGLRTDPLIWLTTSGSPDGTVLAKMRLGGWPTTMAGNLFRFVVGADYPAKTLDEYFESTGVDPGWWKWAIATGELAGSRSEDWRLCLADIPVADWLAVEVLQDDESWIRPEARAARAAIE